MKKAKPIRRIRPIVKAKPKKKVRRNPYSRALDQATAKYNKALLDYKKCLLKKEELELALPRLERMKMALEEYLQGGSVGPLPDIPEDYATTAGRLTGDAMEAAAILRQPLPERVPTSFAPTGFVVPAHLQHMIKDHPLLSKGGKVQGGVTHTQLSSTDPDDMLPDIGPGEDLIPDHKVIV
jgi:hypothetical protein